MSHNDLVVQLVMRVIGIPKSLRLYCAAQHINTMFSRMLDNTLTQDQEDALDFKKDGGGEAPVCVLLRLWEVASKIVPRLPEESSGYTEAKVAAWVSEFPGDMWQCSNYLPGACMHYTSLAEIRDAFAVPGPPGAAPVLPPDRRLVRAFARGGHIVEVASAS